MASPGPNVGAWKRWVSEHRIVTVALIIVSAAWLACAIVAVLMGVYGDDKKLPSAGQFGDTFGTVNALFTGLALIGVAYGISLQHRELEKARLDAAASDEARRKSEVALHEQIAALRDAAKMNAASAIIQANDSLARLSIEYGTRDRWREIDQIRLYEQYLVDSLGDLSGGSVDLLELARKVCVSRVAQTMASWREHIEETKDISSANTQLFTLREGLKSTRRRPEVDAPSPLHQELSFAIGLLDGIVGPESASSPKEFPSVDAYRDEVGSMLGTLKFRLESLR